MIVGPVELRSDQNEDEDLAVGSVSMRPGHPSSGTISAPKLHPKLPRRDEVSDEDGADAVLQDLIHSDSSRTKQRFDTGFMYVARSVSRREVREVPEAEAACRKEWDRLHDVGCWDLSSFWEWRDVRVEVDASGDRVHIGAVHELCMEKGSELHEGHPDRKYKGRVVFLGGSSKRRAWQHCRL